MPIPRTLLLAYRHSLTFIRRLPIYLGIYMLIPIITLYGLNRGFNLAPDQANFMVPGFMVNAAAGAAFLTIIYGSLIRLTMQGSYNSWLAATLTVHNLVQADLLWSCFRSILIATGIGLAGGWIVGGLSITGVLFALPAVVLTAAAASLLGLMIVSRAYGFDDVSIYEPVVAAIFVFSGVFAPITLYPEPIQWLMMLQPIYHGIIVARATYDGTFNLQEALPHLAILLVMCGTFYWLAHRMFTKRLIT